jgi:hypothetical protein
MQVLFFALLVLFFPAALVAADGTYEITKTDAVGAIGSQTKTSVTVTAKQGWHLNHEAPFTLKFSTLAGVQTPKNKLTRPDLAVSTDTVARFDVPLTPTVAGPQKVEAEAGFVLCQDTACRPIKEKVSFMVEGTDSTKPYVTNQKTKKKP